VKNRSTNVATRVDPGTSLQTARRKSVGLGVVAFVCIVLSLFVSSIWRGSSLQKFVYGTLLQLPLMWCCGALLSELHRSFVRLRRYQNGSTHRPRECFDCGYSLVGLEPISNGEDIVACPECNQFGSLSGRCLNPKVEAEMQPEATANRKLLIQVKRQTRRVGKLHRYPYKSLLICFLICMVVWAILGAIFPIDLFALQPGPMIFGEAFLAYCTAFFLLNRWLQRNYGKLRQLNFEESLRRQGLSL